MHPLSGADPKTFALALWRNGRPSGLRGAGTLALCGASVLGRAPFTAGERVWMGRKLPLAGRHAPPIFILGHWRSGTTHLYNIMARGGFAYVPPVATGLPWDMFGLGRWFRPLLERALPKHRYIDNIPVNPDSPQEDEIAIANMCDLSFYHGLYFPRRFERAFNRGVFFDGCTDRDIAVWQDRFRHLLAKLSLQFGGQRLLIKNPVHTARIAVLQSMWPDAAFIHIHRSPYAVFQSMRNFYAKLLRQFAVQDYGHIDIDDHILTTYARMMQRFDAERPGVADNRFVEIGYADLMADPLAALAAVYDRLGLTGFDDAKPGFDAYLQTVTRYQKNTYAYSAADAALVEARCQPWIDRWGYTRPGDGQPV